MTAVITMMALALASGYAFTLRLAESRQENRCESSEGVVVFVESPHGRSDHSIAGVYCHADLQEFSDYVHCIA